MSCNGCRVLRRGCSESCILRPCLQWIASPQAQGNATLFVSKFFGRSDLMSFIAAVPGNKRPALFQSLLFEACGRTVNPVNGAVGLLLTGNWHVCQAAVQTVLSGGTLRPRAAGISEKPSEDVLSEALKLQKWCCGFDVDSTQHQSSDLKLSQAPQSFATGRGINFPVKRRQSSTTTTISFDSEESEVLMSFNGRDFGAKKLRAEEPKLLNLFV
ncbi:hypothetical protein NMG60_11016517 [Bertholletia excelsa]